MRTTSPKEMLLFLWSIAKERPRIMWIIIGCLAALAALQAFPFLILKAFIELTTNESLHSAEAVGVGILLTPKVASYLPSWLIEAQFSRQSFLAIMPVGLVAFGVLRASLNYYYQLWQETFGIHMAMGIRKRQWRALLSSDFLRIQEKPAADWISHLMHDVYFLQSRLSDVLQAFFRDGSQILAILCIVGFLHVPTALVILALAPLMAWGMGRSGKRIAWYTEAFQRELARMAAAVLSLRERFWYMRAQGGEDAEKRRFDAINTAYYRTLRRSIALRALFAPVLELTGFLLFAVYIVLWRDGRLGAELAGDNALNFFVALFVIIRPLKNIGEQIMRWHETRGAMREGLALIFADNDRVATHDSVTSESVVPNLPVRLDRIGGVYLESLAVENVELSPGKSVAIIGGSGAGKSTLLRILAGLVRPKIWESPVGYDAFVAQTNFVSQNPFLFTGSIVENVTYGLRDGAGETSMAQALAAAHVQDDIAKMPHGLQTEIGAFGQGVSGGQRQRLALVRALMRGKPIWLFDEFTASLDMATDRSITADVLEIVKSTKRTILAVTHRLHVLDQFDEVWFMEQGRIILRGTHAELLRNAKYRTYCAQDQMARV